MLVALLLIWLVSRSPGESTPQTSAPVSETQVAGPPGRWATRRSFHADALRGPRMPVLPVHFPVPKALGGRQCGRGLQWHHLPLAAHEPAASAARWWNARAEAAAIRRSGRLSSGSMPTRAATAGACLMTCRHPAPDASHRTVHLRASGPTRRFAQTAEATNSGVTATPSLRLHDRETGKAILLQGPIEGDALAVGHGHARGRRSRRHTHIGNACRRRRRHAQVAPVFKAGAVRCADHNPFASHPGANDHCRGDGSPCSFPRRACPPRAVPSDLTVWRFAMSFAVNDSCLESLSAIAAQHEDWIIQQAIVLLERRSSKLDRASANRPLYGTTCV